MVLSVSTDGITNMFCILYCKIIHNNVVSSLSGSVCLCVKQSVLNGANGLTFKEKTGPLSLYPVSILFCEYY